MSLHVLADWARTPAYSLPAAAVLLAVLGFGVRLARRAAGRVPAAVLVAALGAMVSTAYSADTSWNFARDHLHMTSASERAVMFAAAELGLFAMAFMARQNLRSTGAPGAPGMLVWVVTAVQVIPAYSESGLVAGTVRAFVGPVMAALLWHLAMGIELRHATGGDSHSLPAVLARELRERLLSYLGLAERGRDAVQISRARWTRIATRRAARLADLETANAKPRRRARARRRLAGAVDRTDAGVLPEQRAVLLDRIAAYRHADSLASVVLPSPWQTAAAVPVPAERIDLERVPEPEVQQREAYPQLPPAVPEVVPAGVRPLPIIARPEPEANLLDVIQGSPVPAPVLAAEAPRTRPEVRSEYVPEVDTAGEDPLTDTARVDFHVRLGETPDNVPSIRALRDRYGIGQAKAQRIQRELKEVPRHA